MKKTTALILERAKHEGEDYEWYPTTEEIIDAVAARITSTTEGRFMATVSLMDVGAGDGRVLTGLKDRMKEMIRSDKITLSAIEKSQTMRQIMPREIAMIGADFMEQSLLDKNCSYLFSNPPYKNFTSWAIKLITEANISERMYLVLPSRWRDDEGISRALESRGGKSEILGTYDFLSGDRAARVEVDLVEVRYKSLSGSSFYCFFKQAFKDEIEDLERKDREKQRSDSDESGVEKELVEGATTIEALCNLYRKDIDYFTENTRAALRLDPDLIRELGVSVLTIEQGLESKIKETKRKYWRLLFNYFDPISQRLTSTTRQNLLDSMNSKHVVDFNRSNIDMVVEEIVRTCNQYFDDQLVDLVERLANKHSLALYKSNQRVWNRDEWRYSGRPRELERYGLDYRIIYKGFYSIFDEYSIGTLDTHAVDLLKDIIVIARNLGFVTSSSVESFTWLAGKKNQFPMVGLSGESLLAAKGHKNGNLHFHLHQLFAIRLNVEFGRINGWLRSSKEAEKELGLSEGEANDAFECQYKITPDSALLLLEGGERKADVVSIA